MLLPKFHLSLINAGKGNVDLKLLLRECKKRRSWHCLNRSQVDVMSRKSYFHRITIAVAITIALQALCWTPGNSEGSPPIVSKNEQKLLHPLDNETIEQSSVAQDVFRVKRRMQQSPKKSSSSEGSTTFNSLMNAQGLFSFRRKFLLPLNNYALAVANVKALLEGKKNILRRLYQQYKKKYGKPLNIKTKRMTMFGNKLMKIATHNLQARRGKHSWEMGVNQFTDLTKKEFVAGYTGYTEDEDEVNNAKEKSLKSRPKRQDELPLEIDWVKSKRVSSPLNQRRCQSCTIFAVAGLIDSAEAIKNGRAARQHSPQQILDCSQPDKDICKKGHGFNRTMDYVQNHGIALLKDYKTHSEGKQQECREIQGGTSFEELELERIPKDEESLKLAVANGPCFAQISATTDMAEYSSGIYRGPSAEGNKRNHAILVVGYGTTTIQNKRHDYWYIKNSWGKDWGKEGYFYLARNEGMLQIGIGQMYSAKFECNSSNGRCNVM